MYLSAPRSVHQRTMRAAFRRRARRLGDNAEANCTNYAGTVQVQLANGQTTTLWYCTQTGINDFLAQNPGAQVMGGTALTPSQVPISGPVPVTFAPPTLVKSSDPAPGQSPLNNTPLGPPTLVTNSDPAPGQVASAAPKWIWWAAAAAVAFFVLGGE